jgi:hypothetical protein
MNMEGVPVELSVATILLAMMALLPMPVMTTLPLDERMSSTEEIKFSSILFVRLCIAEASVSRVLTAVAIILSEVFKILSNSVLVELNK